MLVAVAEEEIVSTVVVDALGDVASPAATIPLLLSWMQLTMILGLWFEEEAMVAVNDPIHEGSNVRGKNAQELDRVEGLEVLSAVSQGEWIMEALRSIGGIQQPSDTVQCGMSSKEGKPNSPVGPQSLGAIHGPMTMALLRLWTWFEALVSAQLLACFWCPCHIETARHCKAMPKLKPKPGIDVIIRHRSGIDWMSLGSNY
jgi:hypothetical protein